MSTIRSQDEPTGREAAIRRYATLPGHVRPEDLVAVVETEPPPDPLMGRDPETEFMLRYM